MRIEKVTQNLISKNSAKIGKNVQKAGLSQCIKLAGIGLIYGTLAKDIYTKTIQEEQSGKESPFSLKNLGKVLLENGFIKNKRGSFKKDLSDAQRENLKTQYGENAEYVEKIYDKKNTDVDLACFKDFLELGKEKSQKLFKTNFDDLFLIFSTLKGTSNYKKFRNNLEQNPSTFQLISNVINNEPNKETIASVNNYKNFNYYDINKALRNLAKNPDTLVNKETENDIKNISAYIDTQNICEPVKTYRFEGTSVLSNVKLKNGETVDLAEMLNNAKSKKDKLKVREFVLDNELTAVQDGFLSASLNEMVSKDSYFYHKNGIKWNLTTKPNTKGLFIEAINNKRFNAYENEVLFQKGSNISIKDIHYNKDLKMWEIDGEVSN